MTPECPQLVSPRRQLAALRDVLDFLGAMTHCADIEALPDDIVEALCVREAGRIRAVLEADAPPPAPPSTTDADPSWRAGLRSLIAFIADVVADQLHTGDPLVGAPEASPERVPLDPREQLPTDLGEQENAIAPPAPASSGLSAWLNLDQLERTTPGASWHDAARCKGLDPNWFHPADTGEPREQKAFCSECPVRYECLADQLARPIKRDDDCGVWGGTTPRERRAIRRALKARRTARRNGHAPQAA